MSAELLDQLALYGEVLRDEVDRMEQGRGGAALLSLRLQPVPLSAASRVDNPASLARDGDPPELVERLADVGYQATMEAGREPTDGERADAVDFFTAGGGFGVRPVEIAFQLEGDWVVVDAIGSSTGIAGGDQADPTATQLVTLTNGDEVLIRSRDQQAFFAGPEATHIDVFYQDGREDRVPTTDCR